MTPTLQVRSFTLLDGKAPNARLQLLQYHIPQQLSEESKPGPKGNKRECAASCWVLR